jgi:hypothetical protein
MREIFQAASLYEAQLLVSQLEERGIRTHVRNVDLQGALGELPMTLRPVVCVVSDRDWADAVMVASEFEEAQRRDPGPPLTCGACGEESPGNFQVCWKCRTDLAV